MRRSRGFFETCLQVGTTAVVCLSLWRSANGDRPTVVCLALLCLLASAAEGCPWCQSGSQPSSYAVRAAESSGIALGALTIPWLLAALQAAADGAGPHLGLTNYMAIASAALQLCVLCRPPAAWATRRQGSNGTRNAENGRGKTTSSGDRMEALCYGAGGLAATAPILGCASVRDAAAALGMAEVSCLAFHGLMKCLPLTFTVGEGMVVSQAIVLLASYTLRVALECHIPTGSLSPWRCSAASPFQAFVAGLVLASTGLAGAVAVLVVRGPERKQEQQQHPKSQAGRALPDQAKDGTSSSGVGGSDIRDGGQGASNGQNGVHGRRAAAAVGPKPVRQSRGGCKALAGQGRLAGWRAAAALGVLSAGALLLSKPAMWSVTYATSSWQRTGVLTYWVVLMALALPAMHKLAASHRVSNIIVRKGYHLLAVALFLPAAAIEPQLLGVSLAIAFALLAAVELVRVLDLPIIGHRVHAFMTSFIDSRDSGAVLVTHFTLLLGMAAPLWLSDALLYPAAPGSGQGAVGPGGSGSLPGAAVPACPVGVAGILIIGFGDTAASVVGRLLGRHRICSDSQKTWEGTAGGLAATLLGWWLVSAACSSWLGRSFGLHQVPWPAVVAATALSSLLEAVTSQLDNLFVPLHYFTLVCCSVALGRDP